MSNELVIGNNALSLIDSVEINTIQQTMQKIQSFQNIVQQTLKKGHDFGEVPGTNKPTLLKPGGEKICMMMGLNPEYEIMSETEDFEKGFFNYTFKCRLYRNSSLVSEGVGSCNSKETKYRYIWVTEDKIPSHLNKDDLESKERYKRLEYRIENQEICSLANTILKMAKKRALIDATLQVASLSEIFTQDVEDIEQFNKSESIGTITAEEAAKIKLNFGKHKGSTLKEVYKKAPDYIEWLIENARDASIRKACTLMEDAIIKKQVDAENPMNDEEYIEKAQNTVRKTLGNEREYRGEQENFLLDDDTKLPWE